MTWAWLDLDLRDASGAQLSHVDVAVIEFQNGDGDVTRGVVLSEVEKDGERWAVLADYERPHRAPRTVVSLPVEAWRELVSKL